MQEGIDKKTDSEGMLKGRMAETLVEELLKKSGNHVYRFGYEAIIQNLVQIKRVFDAHTEVGQHIKTIPDFIVVDNKGDASFVEVKYRWNGEMFNENDHILFDKIKHFWNAKIILVNCKFKPYFRIIKPPYFDDSGKLHCKPIVEEKLWNIDEAEYEKFETLIEKYLHPTLKL